MTATRRRGDELEQAIHEAVRAELDERGYFATSFESIAARAGTSKTVLYRRWPTKAEMVITAVLPSQDQPLHVPAADDLAADVKQALRAVRSRFTRTGRETMLMLMAELDTSSGEALRTLLFARGAEIIEPALDRARDRGELGSAVIPRRLLSLPFDLIRNELAMAGSLDDDVIDEIVDQIVLPLLCSRSREE